MDLDARHSLLREKLDGLGFTQPLPIGSLAIVSALLDDLILTTNSLKQAKAQIKQLNEEKVAWELGVEPYKCDNSKLLAECNALNLEIIQQRDTFQQKIFDLNAHIRNLRHDNRLLDEQCTELNRKILELDDQFDPKHKKNRNDLANQRRKPFVSTVRSGEFLPSMLKQPSENTENEAKGVCSKCTCHTITTDLARLHAEREQNQVKTQLELIELYKAQLNSRNREISRLNGLLIGGRPPSALAKDCCYRGVGSLTEDIERLQRQKSKLQTEFEETVRTQHEAMERAIHLKETNKKLAKELDDLKEIALSVETEANSTLGTLHKRNVSLKLKLEESKKYIHELETKLNMLKQRDECSAEKPTSKKALAEANLEIKFLLEKLEKRDEKEEELRSELEKLVKRNAKLKGKLSVIEKSDLSKNVHSRDIGIMTSHPISNLNNECPYDVNRLKIDRDYYQQEYMKLVSRQNSDCELNLLRSRLDEKDYEIKMLRQQLDSLSINPSTKRSETALSCRSVQSTIHRIERQKSLLQDTIERLTIERNELRDSLHLATSTQHDQFAKHGREIEQMTEKIRQLESENISLQSIQGPSKTKIALLKDEICQLRTQITELNAENSKLRTTNNQLRILQEQTESALIEHQSRLTHSARQLGHAESRLSMVDSSRSQGCQEIGELRAEINRLKTINMTLEKEKDKLIVNLDAKTEKLYQLEKKMDSSKGLIMELESQIASTNRQLDNVNSATKSDKHSLQQVTTEVEALRHQINQLKRTNDNAMVENSRLTNELAEMECKNCLTKTKLTESEKEVDKLKSQLQQYVQEVQRAEELLLRKEEERDEMLEHYRSLSHDAVILEGNNHSLEIEAAETKRNLIEAEAKLAHLQNQLCARERELNVCNSKLCELTKQVNQLELDIERYKHERNAVGKELEAVKELCSKLENETDKLNAEVTEYAEIRRELERENEKIRNELLMCKTGDKAAVESLQQLLALSRKEMEDQRMASNQADKEVAKLRNRIEELQVKLSEEHANAVRNETLAREYSVQIQELRNRLIDSKFNQVRTKCLDDVQSNDRFSSF